MLFKTVIPSIVYSPYPGFETFTYLVEQIRVLTAKPYKLYWLTHVMRVCSKMKPRVYVYLLVPITQYTNFSWLLHFTLPHIATSYSLNQIGWLGSLLSLRTYAISYSTAQCGFWFCIMMMYQRIYCWIKEHSTKINHCLSSSGFTQPSTLAKHT